MDSAHTIGVILAGGQSSRMGQNKACLDYNGVSLLDHMISVLECTGLEDIYVSGHQDGYRCIPDNTIHNGPAHAMFDVLNHLDHTGGVLFIPVDMPLLSIDILRLLLKQEHGGYFKNHPLPALIKTAKVQTRHDSVKDFLNALNVPSIALPQELNKCMTNTNTPEDWDKVLCP